MVKNNMSRLQQPLKDHSASVEDADRRESIINAYVSSPGDTASTPNLAVQQPRKSVSGSTLDAFHHESEIVTATEGFFSSEEVTDYKHHAHPHKGKQFEERKEHDVVPPFKAIQRRRVGRILIIGGILFLLAGVVATAVFILVIIPNAIKSSFWGNGDGGDNVFAVLRMSDWHLNPASTFAHAEDVHGLPTTGSWNFTAVTTYSNIFTPLNILLRLYGTSSWVAQIPPSYVKNGYPDPNEASTYSFIGACVPEDMLVTGGFFIINSSNIFITAFNNSIENMVPAFQNSTWPGGKAFTTGLINTFKTGDPKLTPVIALRSTSNFAFGSLYVKSVSVAKPFNFGGTMVWSGFTLPQLTKSFGKAQAIDSAKTAKSAFYNSLTLTSFTVNSVTPPNITVGVDLFLENPMSYGITFQNVYLSATLDKKPLAEAEIKNADIPYNGRKVSLEIEASLGFNLSDIGQVLSSITSTSELTLNNVHMKPGPNTPPIQFINDLLSPIDISLPMSLFGFGGSGGGNSSGNGLQGALGGILSNLAIQLDYAGISGVVDNPAPGYVGAIDLALNTTLSKLSLPLPAGLQPLSIATPLVVSVQASSSYGMSADGSGRDDGDWVSFLELVVESPLEIKDDAIVIASQTAGQLRFPAFPNATQASSKAPLAVAVVKGLSDCFSNAKASAMPKLRVATSLGVNLGNIAVIPPVPLHFEFDVGNLLVSKGWTLPALESKIPGGGNSSGGTPTTSSSSSSAATTFTLPTGPNPTVGQSNPLSNLSLTVANIVVLSSANDLATADFHINLPSNPLELVLTNIQATLSILNTPAAYVQINQIQSIPGTPTITAHGDILAPWAAGGIGPTQAISRLVNLLQVPFSQWVVSVGGFSVQDANGATHAWLNEVLGAIELSVAWSVLYDDTLKPLLQGLLSRLTGGALVSPP